MARHRATGRLTIRDRIDRLVGSGRPHGPGPLADGLAIPNRTVDEAAEQPEHAWRYPSERRAGATVDVEDIVLLEKEGPVARLVLNRPEKGNALPFDALDRLVDLLHETEDDDDVKVVVLKGKGRSFCVGDDFGDVAVAYGHVAAEPGKPPPRTSQRARLAIDRRLGGAVMAFQNSAKPVLAQVQGHCVGIDLMLVEVVDLAICAHSTRFSHAEQRLGLAGNTFNLASLIVAYGPRRPAGCCCSATSSTATRRRRSVS